MEKISERIDLKEIEKKVWLTTFEDGVFDIYFGLLFLGMTISRIFDEILPNLSSIIGLSIIGSSILFFLLVKRYISQPRIGKVVFGRSRIIRKTKMLVVLLINFSIWLILWILNTINPEIKLFAPGFFSSLLFGMLFIATPLFFVAYFLQYKRLYLIAGLIGISFSLEELFYLVNIPEPFDGIIAFGLISTIILSMGLLIFIKFLKKYPLPTK